MSASACPRVLHYTHAARSGAARYVAMLVESLAPVAEGVVLVCPHDFEYSSALRGLDGVSVRDVLPGIPLRGSRAYKALYMGRQALAGLRAIAAAGRPRPVVHFNFAEPSPPSLALHSLCRALGMPIVMTVHDVWPHRFLLPGPFRSLETGILRTRYRMADRLVVHTEGGARTLIADFGIDPHKILVIPLGAFALAAEPLPYRPGSDFRVLLFGALREYKGVHLAIDAVQKLRAEQIPIRLTIAGATHTSERAYWSVCKDTIEASPEGIDVREGYIPSEDLAELFGEAHLVVLPYTQFDSQSAVAAQALASGRIVVATAVGGLGEIIQPEVNGFLIAEPTVEGTSEALRCAVRAGHARLAEMGREAAAHFLAEYSWSAVAAKHASVYQSLASTAASNGRSAW